MVLGSHQFSRHANQRTHGSRTHRFDCRHFACATAPLWHRPIYRQWGIPPRPETARKSVARGRKGASTPRVISGGDQSPPTTTSPTHPKVTRLSRKARNSERDTCLQQPRPPPRADLKAVNAGNPGAGRGFLSGTLRRTQRGSAARSAMRSLFACPRTFRRETPDPPPDSRWGVLDLVGLSTYRRPADQRWQQR